MVESVILGTETFHSVKSGTETDNFFYIIYESGVMTICGIMVICFFFFLGVPALLLM